MNPNDEFYFTICLTENEHDIVRDMIACYCDKHFLRLLYYRKFKTGHVPMYREVKISGNPCQIHKFKIWAKEEGIIMGNWFHGMKDLLGKLKREEISFDEFCKLKKEL